MKTLSRLAFGLLLLTAAHVACEQGLFTAPPGSTLTLVANPTFIPSNGGVSVITAFVVEPAGTPVANGTVIQFFTTLGTIDREGRTNDGVARVNLVSDSRSGIATVTALSGGQAVAPSPAPSVGSLGLPFPSPSPSGTPSPLPSATPPPGGGGTGTGSATVMVTIGSAAPTRIILTADPPQIRSDAPQRVSRLVANVLDANGNPIANVPVIFAVTATPPTETLASGGAPVFTDTNGQATDQLQTSYPRDADPKTVSVTATVSNGFFMQDPLPDSDDATSESSMTTSCWLE
jgi:hypothetical protein